MDVNYSDQQLRLYLNLLDSVGEHWIKLFEGNKKMYRAEYWDLFTNLWRVEEPISKSEALEYLKNVKSPHTLNKLIDSIPPGYIEISYRSDRDKRSVFLSLTREMRLKMNNFFSNALRELEFTAEHIRMGRGL